MGEEGNGVRLETQKPTPPAVAANVDVAAEAVAALVARAVGALAALGRLGARTADGRRLRQDERRAYDDESHTADDCNGKRYNCAKWACSNLL